jgi:hypothetical protein
LQIFCVTNKCARDLKKIKWCSFTKINGYQQQKKRKKKKKESERQTKNVIIKGVYCNIVQNQHESMMRRTLHLD